VHLWTGRDKVNDRPYTADTISIVMSCGKGVTATCAHLLVERGLLDPDAPVAHYWPQFADNGKANLPVSYLLSHRAGLPSFPPESGIALNEMRDWNRCVTALAEMKPLWTPGTAFRYHQFTYGYLVGEVIRRISGKTVGRFFAEEVAGPLNLDLWIGLPEHEEYRVAPVFSSAPLDPVSAAIIGEVDGVRLLSRDTVERARKPQTDGLPEIEPGPYPLRFALGYELSRTGSPLLGTGSFGHAGAGGRLGFVHPESGIAVGYVCNNMLWDYTRGPDDHWLPWSKALREVAGL
jgi:CubicO group peptidase (beta-lactamase class C family)